MIAQLCVKDILDTALQSESGIGLCFDEKQDTKRARRRFYAWREKARQEGLAEYDCLSFIMWDGFELWIIPRRYHYREAKLKVPFVRELTPQESIRGINARGKLRVGTGQF